MNSLVLLSLLYCILGEEIKDLKISASYTLPIEKGVSVFHYTLNFKPSTITIIESGLGNSIILWTDKELATTVGLSKDSCKNNSVICGFISKKATTDNISIRACIDELYIYVLPEDEGLIIFNSRYLEGTCDSIEENDFTKCGAMDYKECDICGDNCRLAECFVQDIDDRQYYPEVSICLPTSETDHSVDERCKGYKGIEFGKWKQECSDTITIGTVAWGTIIILVMLMMSFGGFFFAVVYYNWRLRTTGTPPFKCYKCCPEILFPKPYVPEEETKSNRYQPPNFEMQ